jgi:hypothetical protein
LGSTKLSKLSSSPQLQGSRLIAHPLELVVAIELYIDGSGALPFASSFMVQS